MWMCENQDSGIQYLNIFKIFKEKNFYIMFFGSLISHLDSDIQSSKWLIQDGGCKFSWLHPKFFPSGLYPTNFCFIFNLQNFYLHIFNNKCWLFCFLVYLQYQNITFWTIWNNLSTLKYFRLHFKQRIFKY